MSEKNEGKENVNSMYRYFIV